MSDDHSRANEDLQHAHSHAPDAPGLEGVDSYAAPTPAPSPAILGDARLGGRGNAPVRAAAVQRLQQAGGNRATRQFIQRLAGSSVAVQRDDDIGARIQARAGGGSRLDSGVQRQLETGLGAKMDNVRVHNDSESDHLARSVDSVAFTTGSDIFFRSGTYQPETPQGMHLLAHEATHTVQQAAGPVSGTPSAGGVSISDPSDSFEQAAEASAARVTSGQAATTAQAMSSATYATVQRAAAEEEPVQAMSSATYSAVQREAAEEEEPVQAMSSATYAAVQREAAEEEEPVQAMSSATYAAVQRHGADEEAPVQAMSNATYTAVQREAAEEEEPVQAMSSATYAAVQREAAEEE